LDPENEDCDFFECEPQIEVDDISMIESSMDKFDEVGFDAATFCGIWNENSLRIIMYKLFKVYDLLNNAQFDIPLKSLCNFTLEIQAGYFNENDYHNQEALIDCSQAMHYFFTTGKVKSWLKPPDIFAALVANMMHDYEHPGYTNHFVIRTKHPLAIRYSDISVMENHHLAAAFNVMFNVPECDLLENVGYKDRAVIRKTVIVMVLNTDLSKHFSLQTELKTKLGNEFPNGSIEDTRLILSVALRLCD